MKQLPIKRICLFVAINEKGCHFVSEAGPQEALDGVVKQGGGAAFRVFDLNLDLPYASTNEVVKRRADALDLKVIK